MEPMRVVIAKPVRQSSVDRLRAAVPEVEVVHDPELLAPMRWGSDHHGDPGFRRTPQQQTRFEEMVDSADVLYGFPDTSTEALVRTVRANHRLKWVQAMAAGAGAMLAKAGLTDEELSRIVFTTSAGVHAAPLAEFALLGVLAGTKALPELLEHKENHHWDRKRGPVRSVTGMRIVVVGMGSIGQKCAAYLHELGATVVGVNRSIKPVEYVVELFASEDIVEAARGADVLINALPGAVGTAGLISRQVLEALAPEAIVVSVGRGQCVDEGALIELLTSGRIGFAALDVVASEPLDASSPLWELPNVLISPHRAANTDTQDDEIMDLFIDSLKKFLGGEQPNNVVNTELFY